MTENTKKDGATDARHIGWKGGVIGLLFIAFVGWQMQANGDAPTDTGLPRHEAWGACEEAVKDHLDHPATADFAILTTEDTERPDGGYTFSGSLSAENTFGVEQDLIFSCDVGADGTAVADVRRAP